MRYQRRNVLHRMICVLAGVLFLFSGIPASAQTLQQGDWGEEVSELQQLLMDAGYLNELPDGMFGPITEAAVIAWQEDQGIPVTGMADDAMLEALRGGADEGASQAEGTLPEGAMHCWYEMNDLQAYPNFCADHAETAAQADTLLENGTTESCTQACALWQKEIEEMYDDLLASMEGDLGQAMGDAKEQWKSTASSRHAALEAAWPSDPKEVEIHMEKWLRSWTVSLCALKASIGL